MSDGLVYALARAIRAERQRIGLSQTAFGERMGWSQATQAAIEAGTRKVYASDLPGICDVLGVPLSRLFLDVPKTDLRKLGL